LKVIGQKSEVKVYRYRRKNMAKMVGSTSNEGNLVLHAYLVQRVRVA